MKSFKIYPLEFTKSHFGSSRNRVGRLLVTKRVQSRMGTGCERFESRKKTGMVFPWRDQQSEQDGCGIRMHSWDFDQRPRCEEFSVSPRRVSSALYAAQKNGLRQLRQNAARLVRSTGSSDSRSVVRRYASVPGVRGSPGIVSKLWQSEARAIGVFGEQSVLHQALCLLCGAAVSLGDHQGRG